MSVLHLQHLRSDGERDVFHLKGVRRYHLGRGSTCEVRILDMKMSRQHCAFEYEGDTWFLVDLGSTNGVSLDGERVQGRTGLSAGEVVQAGSIELTVLAISDHIDLAPEELMELKGPTPVQEPMPTVTQDVPIAGDDNPWEGEPHGSSELSESALEASEHENRPTVAVHKQETQAATPVEPTTQRAPLQPVPTPLPQPAAALPHGDGDALEPAVSPAIQAAVEKKPAAAPEKPAPTPAAPAPAAPAQAAATPPRSASAGEMIVSLLDRRIGPIPRDVARELKKKQIMGTLTNAELDQYPQA